MENGYMAYAKEMETRNPLVAVGFCLHQSRGLRRDDFLRSTRDCLSEQVGQTAIKDSNVGGDGSKDSKSK